MASLASPCTNHCTTAHGGSGTTPKLPGHRHRDQNRELGRHPGSIATPRRRAPLPAAGLGGQTVRRVRVQRPRMASPAGNHACALGRRPRFGSGGDADKACVIGHTNGDSSRLRTSANATPRVSVCPADRAAQAHMTKPPASLPPIGIP